MNSSDASTAIPGQPSVPWERVDQFVGQFTHDLRNGLNTMELQLTLLGELNSDASLGEEIRNLRVTLANLSRDMQAVRLASGAVSATLLPYPAGDLLEDLRERQEKRAAGLITWQFPPTAQLARLSLHIDPELLLASLLQLFDNAQQFRAEPASRLSFAAEPQAAGLRMSLSEEKSGPPPASLALETWGETPLYSTRRGGYGLGLFRVRRAIEAQGGTLHAEWSGAPPYQLCSTVSLPATQAPQPPTTFRV